MAVEAQISWYNYSKQPHMVASWDSIGAQLYRWTMTMELRYAVSWPSPQQLSLVRVQFEPVSGHPATNIDDALLESSGCRGNVFTAAMQLQLHVIGKRVKSDTVSVNNVRKYNTNSTGPRTEPCGTEQTMYTTDEVPPAYTTNIPWRVEGWVDQVG